MEAIFGGIEAGGTKFVCAVGSGPLDVRAEVRFPTTSPGETIARAVEFFLAQQERYGALAGLGVASFGPLYPDRASPLYGRIAPTPKPGWSDYDFVGALADALDVPIGFDTDVNGAALCEWRWGAAQGLDTFIYLTIGTGIGGGGMVNGRLLHGLLHPEMGHIRIPHDLTLDPFPGACPFHGDCFEGLASGPAMEKRWGARAETLPADHPAWALEAGYLALGLVSFICTLSPQRILIGGGVMQQPRLFPLIHQRALDLLNDYVQAPQILEDIARYITPPAHGGRAGVLGALALAMQAARSAQDD